MAIFIRLKPSAVNISQFRSSRPGTVQALVPPNETTSTFSNGTADNALFHILVQLKFDSAIRLYSWERSFGRKTANSPTLRFKAHVIASTVRAPCASKATLNGRSREPRQVKFLTSVLAFVEANGSAVVKFKSNRRFGRVPIVLRNSFSLTNINLTQNTESKSGAVATSNRLPPDLR